MNFSLQRSLEILQRTPATLSALLSGLSTEWTEKNEGGDTWSVYDVIGHLIHGDRTDWVERTKIILSDGGDKNFPPFDRFAQFDESKGKTLSQLLEEFSEVRQASIEKLRSLRITEEDWSKTGRHPKFGEVTLAQLLSTWVAHDLDHIYQIARIMAKQYAGDVGPWVEYLKILRQ